MQRVSINHAVYTVGDDYAVEIVVDVVDGLTALASFTSLASGGCQYREERALAHLATTSCVDAKLQFLAVELPVLDEEHLADVGH